MSVQPSRSVGLILGLSLLIGCGGSSPENRVTPTAPGFSTPDIRGVYSAPAFWTFETLRLADGARVSWTCSGRVTIVRQSGPDFLGTFAANPPDGRLCAVATGNITSGVVRRDAGVSFETVVPGQDTDEFFALPGCVVVTQDALWSGRAIGDRFVASRSLTVDCPGDGRMEVTGRADGSRSAALAS